MDKSKEQPNIASRPSLSYVTGGIDRAAMKRADSGHMDALLKSGDARFLPVWKQRHLIAHSSDAGPRPRYISFSEADAQFDLEKTPPVFLGMTEKTPWFALGLAESETPPEIGE